MDYARRRPMQLAEKLLQVRLGLGLSQSEIHRRLGVEEFIEFKRISDYELDKAEPSLVILLQYARIAGVHMEALVDDEIDLPEKLPGPVKYGEIKRQYQSRRKAKR